MKSVTIFILMAFILGISKINANSELLRRYYERLADIYDDATATVVISLEEIAGISGSWKGKCYERDTRKSEVSIPYGLAPDTDFHLYIRQDESSNDNPLLADINNTYGLPFKIEVTTTPYVDFILYHIVGCRNANCPSTSAFRIYSFEGEYHLLSRKYYHGKDNNGTFGRVSAIVCSFRQNKD